MADRRGARIEVPLLFVAGLLLIGMSARYAIGSALLLPSVENIAKLQQSQTVSAEELDTLIENQTTALHVDPSAESWSNLSLALAVKARSLPPTNPDGQSLLSSSEDALRQSLGLAPLNPFAWIRLALIEQANGKPENDILKFWRFSELVGPSEPKLAIPRAELALTYWDELTPEDRRQLFSNLRQAWKNDSSALLTWSTTPTRAALVRASLVFDLPELTRFEKALVAARNTTPK